MAAFVVDQDNKTFLKVLFHLTYTLIEVPILTENSMFSIICTRPTRHKET